MAHQGHEFELMVRSPHDGVLRCMLCAADEVSAGHDWCDAAGCIICDECCDALLAGDPQAAISIIATSGRIVTLEAIARTCRGCPRAEAHAVGRALEEDIGPPC